MEAQKTAAIILAAGTGKRLQRWALPKCLLPFSGSSLLERHLRALHGLGINDIHITGGYRMDALSDELHRIGLPAKLMFNKNYMRGSMLSLSSHAPLLRSGKSILLMDADVLFVPEILRVLIGSKYANSLLVDMCPVDDEAVKLCFVGDTIADFHKQPERSYDRCGESIGFFRLSPEMATVLADRCDFYVEQGLLDLEYEAPLRDLLIEQPEAFGAEDITGLAWVEIDFDADVERANREVLPHLPEVAEI